MSLNNIAVMGRMTKDPELRRTATGTAVTSFTLAVDRDFKNQDGSRDVDFIDVVAWRNTAEFVSKYFTKGRMVVVTGSLQIRDWQDKEGHNRRNAEIIANNIYFADSKREADGDRQTGRAVDVSADDFSDEGYAEGGFPF